MNDQNVKINDQVHRSPKNLNKDFSEFCPKMDLSKIARHYHSQPNLFQVLMTSVHNNAQNKNRPKAPNNPFAAVQHTALLSHNYRDFYPKTQIIKSCN